MFDNILTNVMQPLTAYAIPIHVSYNFITHIAGNTI